MESENLVPEKLQADIHRFMNKDERWMAFIILNNDMPFEIISCIVKNELEKLPSRLEECNVIKFNDENNKHFYDVEFVNKEGTIIVAKDITNSTPKEFRNYALLITSLLQNSVPVTQIIDVLMQCEFQDYDYSINKWQHGILRFLKKYVPDKETRYDRGKCHQCNNGRFILSYGNMVCSHCGYCLT